MRQPHDLIQILAGDRAQILGRGEADSGHEQIVANDRLTACASGGRAAALDADTWRSQEAWGAPGERQSARAQASYAPETRRWRRSVGRRLPLQSSRTASHWLKDRFQAPGMSQNEPCCRTNEPLSKVSDL